MPVNTMRVPTIGRSSGGMPEYGNTSAPVAAGNVSARFNGGVMASAIANAGHDWRDIMALGKAGLNAGLTANKLYMDYQSCRAKEAHNAYQQDLLALKSELATLEGKNAMDEKTGVQARIAAFNKTAAEKYGKDLGDIGKRMFGVALEKDTAELNAWGTSKTDREFKSWQNTVDEGRILTAQDMALADPSKLPESMGLVKAAYENMAQRNGWDADFAKAKMQQVQQKTVGALITQAVDGEDLGQARRIMQQYGGLLGGARKGYEARIAAKGRALQARYEGERQKAQLNGFLTATAEMSPQEKLDALQKTFGGDQKMYRAALSAMVTAQNQQETMRKYEDKIRFQGFTDQVTQFASLPPDQSYAKTQELIAQLPVEQREKAYKLANNIRLAHSPDAMAAAKDDPLALQELTERMSSGEAVNIAADYGDRISLRTRNKLEKAAFREALPSIKTAFNDAANTWLSNEDNKSDAKKRGGDSASKLWTHFLAQTDADEKKDYTRLRQEAEQFFKATTINKGNLFNTDLETIKGFEPSYYSQYEDALPAKGSDEYIEARRALEITGVAPESGNNYSKKQIRESYRILRAMRAKQ